MIIYKLSKRTDGWTDPTCRKASLLKIVFFEGKFRTIIEALGTYCPHVAKMHLRKISYKKIILNSYFDFKKFVIALQKCN